VTINGGGYARSPTFCVASGTPYFRFSARKVVANSWGSMNVYVLWTNQSGQPQTTAIGNLGPNNSWTLSTAYGLGAILPTASGATFPVQLKFAPLSGRSSLQVTDVYIDPYSKH
jgi:hypothetical protein